MASGTCLVLAVLLLAPALAGWWVRTTVTDTDDYVATVAPLAEQAEVQETVVEVVTDLVLSQLDRVELLPGLARALERQGIPPALARVVVLLREPLRDRTAQRVEAVAARVVTSDAFASGWRTANATAHARLVAVLEDEDGAVFDARTISVRLATVVEAVVAALEEAGVPGADRIDPVPASFDLVAVESVEDARTGYQLLRTASVVLVVLVVVLLAAGLALARTRRTALLRTAIGGLLALVALLALLAWGRQAVVDALPLGSPGTTTEAVVDVVTARLREWVRWSALALLLVALVCLVGPAQRSRLVTVLDRLREHPWVPLVAGALAATGLLAATLLPAPGPGVLTGLLAVSAAGLALALVTAPRS